MRKILFTLPLSTFTSQNNVIFSENSYFEWKGFEYIIKWVHKTLPNPFTQPKICQNTRNTLLLYHEIFISKYCKKLENIFVDELNSFQEKICCFDALLPTRLQLLWADDFFLLPTPRLLEIKISLAISSSLWMRLFILDKKENNN